VVRRNVLLAGGKRQKRPAELAFPEESRGEAPMATEEGPNHRRRSVYPRARRRQSTLNQPNRRVRTRTHGGVGGVEPRGSPLSRFRGGATGGINRRGADGVEPACDILVLSPGAQCPGVASGKTPDTERP
jgi:hypothetical protein